MFESVEQNARLLIAAIDAPPIAHRRGSVFGIDASSYDLWRGNTFDDADGSVGLRFHPYRRLCGPRSPGAAHRHRCEVEVVRDGIEAAGIAPFWAPHPRAPVAIHVPSIFDEMRWVTPHRPPIMLVSRRALGQLYPEPIDLSAARGFTFAAGRQRGKSEVMRVVAMDHARREITFTADEVYERPLPPRSRVPAGLQKRRLDGRRQR